MQCASVLSPRSPSGDFTVLFWCGSAHWRRRLCRLSWPVYPLGVDFAEISDENWLAVEKFKPQPPSTIITAVASRCAQVADERGCSCCRLVLTCNLFAKMTNNGFDGWFSILPTLWTDGVIINYYLEGNIFTGHFDQRGQKIPDFDRFYQSKSGNYRITETQAGSAALHSAGRSSGRPEHCLHLNVNSYI